MKVTRLADIAVDTEANAFAALMDGGYIDIHGGTQPETADTPLSGQPLAVALSFGSPAFRRSVGGTITANPIDAGVAVETVNPVTWARIYRADHRTSVMDVSVGTRNAVLLLPSVNVPANITVTCSSFSHTVIKSKSD